MKTSDSSTNAAPAQQFSSPQGEIMSAQGPSRLNPGTSLGYVELLIRNRVGQARNRVISGPRDRGASVVEWVIISALVIGVAVAVAAALTTKLTGAVDNLNVTGGN
jgi:hypothetical protein